MSIDVIRVACWRGGHTAKQITTFVRDAGTWGARIVETRQIPTGEPPPDGIATEEWVRRRFQVDRAEAVYKYPLRCRDCRLDARTVGMAKLAPILDWLATEPPDAGTARIFERVIVVPLETIARELGASPKRPTE